MALLYHNHPPANVVDNVIGWKRLVAILVVIYVEQPMPPLFDKIWNAATPLRQIIERVGLGPKATPTYAIWVLTRRSGGGTANQPPLSLWKYNVRRKTPLRAALQVVTSMLRRRSPHSSRRSKPT